MTVSSIFVFFPCLATTILCFESETNFYVQALQQFSAQNKKIVMQINIENYNDQLESELIGRNARILGGQNTSLVEISLAFNG